MKELKVIITTVNNLNNQGIIIEDEVTIFAFSPILFSFYEATDRRFSQSSFSADSTPQIDDINLTSKLLNYAVDLLSDPLKKNNGNLFFYGSDEVYNMLEFIEDKKGRNLSNSSNYLLCLRAVEFV